MFPSIDYYDHKYKDYQGLREYNIWVDKIYTNHYNRSLKYIKPKDTIKRQKSSK